MRHKGAHSEMVVGTLEALLSMVIAGERRKLRFRIPSITERRYPVENNRVIRSCEADLLQLELVSANHQAPGSGL